VSVEQLSHESFDPPAGWNLTRMLSGKDPDLKSAWRLISYLNEVQLIIRRHGAEDFYGRTIVVSTEFQQPFMIGS